MLSQAVTAIKEHEGLGARGGDHVSRLFIMGQLDWRKTAFFAHGNNNNKNNIQYAFLQSLYN